MVQDGDELHQGVNRRVNRRFRLMSPNGEASVASYTWKPMEFPPLEVMVFQNRILTFKQLEGERIHRSWARFNELINQCPNHDIPNVALLDCFYRDLGPGNKRLVDQLIPGGIAKQPYVIAARLLNQMAETNQEVEKDFMLAALMTQMDELAKKMVKIEVQCKRKDKYIPLHERRSLKDNEVKSLEGMLSIILNKVKVWRVCGNCVWRTNSSIQQIAEQVGDPDENCHLDLLFDRRAGDATLKSKYRQMAKFDKSERNLSMTKPNKAGSNTPLRGKEKGITINEDATASRTMATKLSTISGKGKDKDKTVELSDASFDSTGFYTNDPTTYDSEGMGSDKDELMEARRNQVRSNS
uniref:Retrotransposon gag protein n=1 Tax=Solanum tuberosum TaxID=4113 RepID=M1DXV6_SOLTU